MIEGRTIYIIFFLPSVREACKSAHDSFYLCVLSNKGHYYQGDIWTQYNPVNEIKFYDIFEVKNSIPLIEM